MTRQTVDRDGSQRREAAAPSARREEAAFRPVALPAVAAAVRATAFRPRHLQPNRRDVPAILRKDVMTD